MPYDVTLAFRVRQQIEKLEPFVEKRMFGGIAWMVKGHMACGIIEDRLMVRLEVNQAERLLKLPDVSPMDFTGRPMAGYLWVEGGAIDSEPKLKKWVALAVAHARKLPAVQPHKLLRKAEKKTVSKGAAKTAAAKSRVPKAAKKTKVVKRPGFKSKTRGR